MLGKLLAPLGECVTAGDGLEAVELFDKSQEEGQRYDLICMDVMMPNLDGWGLCRKVKGDPRLRGVSVLILTARNRDVDEFMSYESQADAHMGKPFEFQELLDMVRSLAAPETAPPCPEQPGP